MSTRRTTRATSRAASSRAASSVGVSALDAPRTPSAVGRRSARNSVPNSPLPTLGLRTSTAYGSNSPIQPSSMRGPETRDQINNVLSNILEPVREEEDSPQGNPGPLYGGMFAPPLAAPPRAKNSRRGAAAASATTSATSAAPAVPAPANASFGFESGVYGVAGVNSSSFAESSRLSPTPELPVPKQPVLETPQMKTQKPIVTEVAKETRVEPLRNDAPTPTVAVAAQPSRFVAAFISDVTNMFWAALAYAVSMLNLLRAFVLSTRGRYASIAIVAGLAMFGIVTQTNPRVPSIPIRWYGFDVSHNIGQFIPYTVSHPLSIFKDDTWQQEFEKRLTAAEYDIAHLKTRMTLDSKAISHLESILPDTIVCPRDGNGNLQIPNHFWYALKDKLLSDQLVEVQAPKAEPEPEPASGTGLSKKQVISLAEKVFERSNTKNWDNFLRANRAQITSWSNEEFGNQILASKSEFMKLIQQNWADTKDAIMTQMAPHVKGLESIGHRVFQLEKTEGVSRHEIRSIALDVSKKLIVETQLSSLTKANLQSITDDSLYRVNHFSLGTGAAINPYLTTLPFIPFTIKRGLVARSLSWFVDRPVPVPNPPSSAITRWEEHGDCWCSELNSTKEVYPTLGVIMARNIYPDQVIVEHIPTTASLKPGSAPKEIELWAFIPDIHERQLIEEDNRDVYDNPPDPKGLIQIGSWTYDTHTMNHIQAFPIYVGVSMRNFGVSTNNLQVRVKSNWGGDKTNFACLYRIRVNGAIPRFSDDEKIPF